MRYAIKFMIVLLMISCGQNGPAKDEILESNPYLIGKWTGEGSFMDIDFAKKMGEVPISIVISADHKVTGSIGEAVIDNITISKASYGFDIKGILNSRVNEAVDFDKDHIIILLVLPEENRENNDRSSANFHLKSNFVFDFGMRVGGVELIKN